MKITIITFGDSKKSLYQQALDEYQRRIKWPVKTIILKPLATTIDSPQQIRKLETQQIIANLPSHSYVISLDSTGESYDSAKFAGLITQLQNRACKEVCFIIGGAHGCDRDLLAPRADLSLSFGTATWPHMLVRVMVLEQIYRAQQIHNHHPYSK